MMQPHGLIQRCCAVALLSAIALVAGCQTIHVVDQYGEPVEGVRITSQYADENGAAGDGPSGVTNQMGNAHLSRPVFGQDPQYMTVRKLGYMPVGLDYPSQWYATVILQSVSGLSEPSNQQP
jgi:hypothetical protein